MDYIKIPLHGKHGKGKFTLISPEDYDLVSQYKWKVHSAGYAYDCKGNHKKGTFKIILMHRLIMGEPNGMFIDHINHDKLDNTRANLRICTNGQNKMNCKSAGGSSSKYKGVSWKEENKKWQSQIKTNGKVIFLGYYKIEAAAALAYNKKALELFGEFAHLNKVTL